MLFPNNPFPGHLVERHNLYENRLLGKDPTPFEEEDDIFHYWNQEILYPWTKENFEFLNDLLNPESHKERYLKTLMLIEVMTVNRNSLGELIGSIGRFENQIDIKRENISQPITTEISQTDTKPMF